MLSGPVVNRLGGADWGQLVAGQVFADALAVQLGEALDGAAKASSDPKIEIDTRPSAHWSSVPPRAHSDAEITAVEAILGTINVPIRIYATTELFPNASLGHVELRITVHWYAHDFVTMASGGAIDWVEDDVSDAILEQFQTPPKDLEEVERDREHIVFRQRLPLSPLKLPLVWTTITAAAVDGTGLSATGAMTVAPPPVGFFTLEPPHWTSGIDCGSRSYKITFHPPAVHLVSSDRTFNQQFRAAVVEPTGLWIPTITWAAATASAPQVMSIVFEGPHQPTQPPTGSGSSAYINTNLGVRWVDFGNVPPKPPMPADPVATQVEVYNTCLLLTDRWGRGVLEPRLAGRSARPESRPAAIAGVDGRRRGVGRSRATEARGRRSGRRTVARSRAYRARRRCRPGCYGAERDASLGRDDARARAAAAAHAALDRPDVGGIPARRRGGAERLHRTAGRRTVGGGAASRPLRPRLRRSADPRAVARAGRILAVVPPWNSSPGLPRRWSASAAGCGRRSLMESVKFQGQFPVMLPSLQLCRGRPEHDSVQVRTIRAKI